MSHLTATSIACKQLFKNHISEKKVNDAGGAFFCWSIVMPNKLARRQCARHNGSRRITTPVTLHSVDVYTLIDKGPARIFFTVYQCFYGWGVRPPREWSKLNTARNLVYIRRDLLRTSQINLYKNTYRTDGFGFHLHVPRIVHWIPVKHNLANPPRLRNQT